MKHKGDPIPVGGQVISKEEFGEGVKRISKESETPASNPAECAMNPPEQAEPRQRRRRTR